MALKVYKITEYDHIAERKQFESVKALLSACNGNENSGNDNDNDNDKDNGNVIGNINANDKGDCILIGNYNIEGVELDALLICRGGVRILEFKNWGGEIIARENGDWTAENMIIGGGSGQKSPYTQIRLNRSRCAAGLKKFLGSEIGNISAAIIFAKDSHIDSTQMSDSVKKWLTLCDNSHLASILNGLGKQVFTDEMIESIPSALHIEEFEEGSDLMPASPSKGFYAPESSESIFEELELALTQLPDIQKTYAAFNKIFKHVLNENTKDTKATLGGTFAKTDYLLKEHSAGRQLIRNTNDTRSRLRHMADLSEKDLTEYCMTDLRNLCEFVAFIYNTSIPASLKARFTKRTKQTASPTLIKEYMRVVVQTWDENYVYCKWEESTEGELLKVYYKKTNLYNQDYSYLSNYFEEGSQLNLIRPRMEDGVINAEMFIFEPDYLVDISAVANCFTNYADSHLVNLLKKISPKKDTEATLLGNLASQLLDEVIHQLPGTHSYKDSAMEFYKHNTMGLLTTEISHDFHYNAQRQKDNIMRALNETLPNDISSFDLKEAIVEPSFFSEMLGLQGRMDYLQLDYKVLIEQKSGKGEFPQGDYTTPAYKTEHYVQLLLYMLIIRYNYRKQYEANNQLLNPFLMYSKYQKSLIRLGFSPDLIFSAIKIRNGIAWSEMHYAKLGGLRILESMTADSFNLKHTNNPLWNKYQRPDIEKLLSCIGNASDLEKAYYFRFLEFVSNEHLLSKIGNNSKEDSGFAAAWQYSAADKRDAGNIYYNLKLLSPGLKSEGMIEYVELGFSDSPDHDIANFRSGDIVVLYPYVPSEEPDMRKTMVFRSTIAEIGSDRILLRLRNPQSDNRVFVKQSGKLWAIEHDFMESSYGSFYRGLHAFLSAPRKRRDLLLLQRHPEHDESLSLKGEYGRFNDLMLKVKQAKDLFLIIGPPGTGKTSFGMLNTVKEELSEPGSNIIIMSYTNRAVDEICSKLTEEGIDYIRLGSDLSCSADYRCHLLSHKVEESQNISEIKSMVSNTRVFVGTTTSFNSNISLFSLKQFDLAVIDEASQILEPHLIGLLSATKDGNPAIRKIVMIGDHKQLPAVVKQPQEMSKVTDPLLKSIELHDCRLSLFERMLRRYGRDNHVTYMLRRQGRMHQDIALFPNIMFYNNQLEVVPLDHQVRPLPLEVDSDNGIDIMLQTHRIAFISIEPEMSSSSDKVNQEEADMIAATVIRIYELERSVFRPEETVGVIVPYRNQIATVRKAIDQYGINALHDITIDTVERYQGSQRRYIVYGFTIKRHYQLNFLTGNVFEDVDGTIVDRKLNVAMTRAEEHLILIGNAPLLSNNFTFSKLIEFVQSRHGYFHVNRDDYVSGRFTVPR